MWVSRTLPPVTIPGKRAMNLPFPVTGSPAPYKILRMYLKSASVEVPHMSCLPQQALSPQIGVDMQTEAKAAWPGALECVLRISLHARLDGKNVFLLEVSEAAVFELDLSNAEEAHRFVRKVAPSVLFPFARKDLASLAVAAGFQPVLLDHVDFGALLEQVIASQRSSRPPAPMRLDVIAAKPGVVVPAPAPAPAPLPTTVTATTETVTVAVPTRQKRRPQTALLALLGMITLGASLAWWLAPNYRPAVVVPLVSEAAAPVLPAASSPMAVPIVVPVVLAADTQLAIDTSRARLKEQPADWFTVALGSWPTTAPLEALGKLELDRPLFVINAADNSLRLYYGVFPSRDAAERASSQVPSPDATQSQPTATVVTIGSL